MIDDRQRREKNSPVKVGPNLGQTSLKAPSLIISSCLQFRVHLLGKEPLEVLSHFQFLHRLCNPLRPLEFSIPTIVQIFKPDHFK